MRQNSTRPPKLQPFAIICLKRVSPALDYSAFSSATATGAPPPRGRQRREKRAARVARRPVGEQLLRAVREPAADELPAVPADLWRADAHGGAHAAAVALVHVLHALGTDVAGVLARLEARVAPRAGGRLVGELERGRAVVPVGQVGGGAEEGQDEALEDVVRQDGRDAERGAPRRGRRAGRRRGRGRTASPSRPSFSSGWSPSAPARPNVGYDSVQLRSNLPHGVHELRRHPVPRHGALAPVGAARAPLERHRALALRVRLRGHHGDVGAAHGRAEDRVAAAQLRRHALPQLPPLRVEGRDAAAAALDRTIPSALLA